MPHGYPWGMLENFMQEGYNLDSQASSVVQAVGTLAPPVVHITPAARNEIHYIAPPSMNAMPFVNVEVYHHVPPLSESMVFMTGWITFKTSSIRCGMK